MENMLRNLGYVSKKKDAAESPLRVALLNSKDYDFKETIEIKNDIQLTESDVNFFNNKNNIEKCISHGFIFSKNELYTIRKINL